MWLCTLVVATTVISLAPSTILAQTALFNPGQNGVNYRVNIPTSTSQSRRGPIYFQIQAPTSVAWVGLGEGSRMAGSNIFMVYAASNSNITLSPRLGRGEFQPRFNSEAQVSLLEGTGISNDIMTANVRCDNCLSWDGGSMDLSDQQAPWIWSLKNGSPIDSTSVSQNLEQHDVMGQFDFDLTQATGGSSANPFIDASGLATSSTATSGASSGTTLSQSTIDRKRKAHAALMLTAFTVLFPLAALSLHLPVNSIPVVPFIHAPIQVLSLVLILAGMGIGISLTQDTNYLTNPVQAHIVIGLVVVGTLTLFQPTLGLIQHLHFRRTGGRSIWAYVHRWLGRTMILLGIINGGLGFRLAGIGTAMAPRRAVVAYGVVAGVIGLAWLAIVAFPVPRARQSELKYAIAMPDLDMNGDHAYENRRAGTDADSNRMLVDQADDEGEGVH